MSNSAIDAAAAWIAGLCKLDRRCILRDGHDCYHRDLETEWHCRECLAPAMVVPDEVVEEATERLAEKYKDTLKDLAQT